MSRILLIETATEVCSAGIAIDGKLVALEEIPNTQSHAALLTQQIAACAKTAGLALNALDAVAVSSGPGSYTGLRVGASVAKGICFALDKPLIAVDTLLALASGARDWARLQQQEADSIYVPALDARRQEIWTAVYDASLQALTPAQPLILENNSFEKFLEAASGHLTVGRALVVGNGTDKIRSGNPGEGSVFFTEIKCSARYLVDVATRKFQAADFQDVAYFEPFYMKLPNITTPNNMGF